MMGKTADPHIPGNGGVRDAKDLGAFWDGKYEAGNLFGNMPNTFVTENISGFKTGANILVPGDGYGRNGVWLAGQGFAVTSLEISPLAIQKARSLAAEAGVPIDARLADLTRWQPEQNTYDGVIVAFVHIPAGDREAVHEKYVQALAPGGRLVFQAYAQAQLGRNTGGPKALELLYTTDQLAGDFAELEIDLLEERIIDMNEGTHHKGEAAVISMLATKLIQE